MDANARCPQAAEDPEDDEEIERLCTHIHSIPMRFKIWNNGRREDSDGINILPVEQPAQILPDVRLYIGDIDDAADIEKLKRLNIKSVVNVCSEQVSKYRQYYWLPSELAAAQIDQLILVAEDRWDFNILPVAEKAFGFIKKALKESESGVLIHCYGGVNRSGAIAAAYLTDELSLSLYEAIECLRHVRGTVLTYKEFVRQLVKNSLKPHALEEMKRFSYDEGGDISESASSHDSMPGLTLPDIRNICLANVEVCGVAFEPNNSEEGCT